MALSLFLVLVDLCKHWEEIICVMHLLQNPRHFARENGFVFESFGTNRLSFWDILCLQPKRETETNEDSTQTKPEYLTAFD